MNKYVVFRDRNTESRTRFWTGEITPAGSASETVSRELAVEFDSAKDAYDAATPHQDLQYWKVGRA